MSNRQGIVDVNVWLGAWPFQYFREDSGRPLEARLQVEGIHHAMVGSPEAAFNQDCMATNRLLLRRLAGTKSLHPVAALDPTRGDWRDILGLCRDEKIAAVRLFPTYHCYELVSDASRTAIEEIARAGDLVLFLQVRMEDERTHHPLCRIPALTSASVIELAALYPGLPMVALCPSFAEAVQIVRKTTNVRVDISHVETLRTLASFLDEVPRDRVLFGSHAPFLYPRAAVMKLDAPYVSSEARRAIGGGNARSILAKGLRARG